MLDLFAGSGAIGLECLSRGAKKAILCDKSKEAVEIIKRNIEKTHMEDKAQVFNTDFETCLEKVKNQQFDIIYLDPPYFHTKGRYFWTINFERFLNYLEDLNKRNINYILSFDGLRGEANYTVNIPKDLYKRHELLQSGNSTFKKVIGKETEKVFESLYMNF